MNVINRMMSLMRKDLVNATRDNVMIYMLVAPLLMAFGFRLFLPSVQGMTLTFAADAHIEAPVVDSLRDYGKVELYDDPEALRARVARPDDVAGFTKDGEGYVIVLEGNEEGEAAEMAGAILDKVLSTTSLATFQHESLGQTDSPFKQYTAALLALTAILLAGLIIGLNIVDEKENGAIRALAVTPMTMRDFIAARSILALALAIILVLASSLILVGLEAHYGLIAVGVVCSIGLSIGVGLLIGGIADNQISAIAVLKILFLVYLWIPLGSIFVPDQLQGLFYIFPNYWMFQIFRNVYVSGPQIVGYWAACALTLFSSGALIAVAFPALRRRFKLA